MPPATPAVDREPYKVTLYKITADFRLAPNLLKAFLGQGWIPPCLAGGFKLSVHFIKPQCMPQDHHSLCTWHMSLCTVLLAMSNRRRKTTVNISHLVSQHSGSYICIYIYINLCQFPSFFLWLMSWPRSPGNVWRPTYSILFMQVQMHSQTTAPMSKTAPNGTTTCIWFVVVNSHPAKKSDTDVSC